MNNEMLISKMYLSGDSITTISNELNTDRRTIYRVLEKNDVTLRSRNNFTCLICFKACTKNICGSCNTNLRRYRTKKAAIEFLGGKCNRCSWVGHISGYDIHHVNPELKTIEPTATNLAAKSWDIVKKELENCELLCALCHRLHHSKHDDEIFQEVLKKYNGRI